MNKKSDCWSTLQTKNDTFQPDDTCLSNMGYLVRAKINKGLIILFSLY